MLLLILVDINELYDVGVVKFAQYAMLVIGIFLILLTHSSHIDTFESEFLLARLALYQIAFSLGAATQSFEIFVLFMNHSFNHFSSPFDRVSRLLLI